MMDRYLNDAEICRNVTRMPMAPTAGELVASRSNPTMATYTTISIPRRHLRALSLPQWWQWPAWR